MSAGMSRKPTTLRRCGHERLSISSCVRGNQMNVWTSVVPITVRTTLLLLVASLVVGAAPAMAQTRPPTVYVDEGACPFECCLYGRWWATGPVELRTAPRAEAPVIDTVAPGDTVLVETGEVRTIPAPFLVKKALDRYAPGDTIWVLTYLGEGFFRVWDEGEVRELELEFSPYGGSPGARCERCSHGELLTLHRSEWWVRVKTASGIIGWTNATESFDGNYGCGLR